MCSPTLIASTVITAATTAYGAYSEYQNAQARADVAKEQAAYQRRNFELEAEANRNAAQRQIDQLNLKQTQQRKAYTTEKMQLAREAKERNARIIASGESALNTGLMAGLLAESGFDYGLDMSNLKANESADIQQTQYEKREARERGRTVGLGPTAMVTEPSATQAIIGGGLGVAGAGIRGYQKYKDRQG